MIDHYAVLGLGPTAEQIVVKAAYRTLAMEYHPDRVGDDEGAHKRMAEINAAYEVLGDPETRSEYDKEYEEAQRRGKPPTMPTESQSNWEIAVEYYPEIQVASNELELISSGLASAFRMELLRKRDFGVADRLLPKKMLRDYFKREYSDAKEIWDVFATLHLMGKGEVVERLLSECKVTGNPVHVWNRRGQELLSEWGMSWDPKAKVYRLDGKKHTAYRSVMLEWAARDRYVSGGEVPWWIIKAFTH